MVLCKIKRSKVKVTENEKVIIVFWLMSASKVDKFTSNQDILHLHSDNSISKSLLLFCSYHYYRVAPKSKPQSFVHIFVKY